MMLLTIFRQKPEYLDFCIAELKSLLYPYYKNPFTVFEHELKGHEEYVKDKHYRINREIFTNFPFVYIKVDNEDIPHEIIKRAILIRAFVDVFAEGDNYEELFSNLNANMDKARVYIESEVPIAFEVEANNKSLT